MASGLIKRKAKTSATSRKKIKTGHLNANELSWKTVSTSKEAGITSDFDGILELEEVDNVEVVYEETEGGKIARFQVVDNSSSSEDENDIDPTAEKVASSSSLPVTSTTELLRSSQNEELSFDSKSLLSEWHPFDLHPRLLRTLYAQRFINPTPIQAEALPTALKGKDVVGVAETGSGKTLAYGLPILDSLLKTSSSRSTDTKQKRSTRALILTPTRELAFQVSTHLNACLQDVEIVDPAVKSEQDDSIASAIPSESKGSKNSKTQKGKRKQVPKTSSLKPKGPPPVSVAAIVGGMSAQKQRRILDRGVDVLVATPGRLWDILQQDDDLASQIKNLRFLVLDEADRMIETGHFAELDNILRLTMRTAKDEAIESEESETEEPEASTNGDTSSDMQTFVFSATLSKDLQKNLKKRQRWHGKKKRKPASTLDDLVMKLDFRDPEPTVIDLSPEGGVVSTLRESKIDCLGNDKDAYLYYFLLRYPGRSLVFLSSIDGIRRLLPLMELLEVKAFPLHSQLEQRQRLKNLDRFKNTPNSVLLATDIAARGLDIPSVDHVVHYQVPRTADAYVHRNGRTARAMRDGFSMLMCAPDERRIVRALLNSLGRNEEEIPEMTAELYMLDKLKARVQLARQIDTAQHKVKKENHEKHWLREAAEAMEIEIDSDMGLSDDDDDSKAVPTKHQKKTANAKTAVLKAELKDLLAQPLIARGVSTRYITSGSRSIVDDVMAGQYHEGMLGLKKTQAGTDLAAPKKKPKPKTKKEEFEEWHGIESQENVI